MNKKKRILLCMKVPHASCIVSFVFRRAVKPVYSYILRLDFGDSFRYLYSNNLVLEK